jgi:hypothetical protein
MEIFKNISAHLTVKDIQLHRHDLDKSRSGLFSRYPISPSDIHLFVVLIRGRFEKGSKPIIFGKMKSGFGIAA